MKKNSLVIATIILLLVISIGLNNLIDSKELVLKTLTIGVINILNFIILIRFTFGKKFQINLLIVFMIGLFISSLLPQLYLVLRINEIPFIDSWKTSIEYSRVSTYTLIGIIFLTLGYRLTSRKNSKIKYLYESNIKPNDMLLLVIILLVIAWVARFILFINGTYYFAYKDPSFMFGQWYSVLSQFSNLGIFALIIILFVHNKYSKYRKFLISIVLLELLWVVPSGARMSIAIIILVIGFYFWYKDKEVPVKKLIVIFLLFTMSFPVLGLYRYTIGNYSDMSSFNIENTIMALNAANKLIETSDQLKGMNSFDSFISRLYDGNSLGFLLINYSDDYDWQYGWTILRGTVGIVVPYFIFPQREINQLTLNEWYPSIQAGGSSPVTFLGEGYINFSYFGFFILPFLLGTFLKKIDLFFYKRSSNLIYKSLYFFLLVNFVFMYSQGMVIMLSTLRLVFIYGIFTFILITIINPKMNLFAYK